MNKLYNKSAKNIDIFNVILKIDYQPIIPKIYEFPKSHEHGIPLWSIISGMEVPVA